VCVCVCDLVCVVAEDVQQSPVGKDKDPRKFAHFRLHCLHCGAAEHSFGNFKFHMSHECTQRNNVFLLCGCCGAIFKNTRSLSAHLNVYGVHLRFSSIPAYSPDTLFLPPESATVPAQMQSVLSSQSSACRPGPIHSTPPASTSTVITLLDSSAINAAASSVPAFTSPVASTSMSSLSSEVPTYTSSMSTEVPTSMSSLSWDPGADSARENAWLYTQLNLRTLQLIWLASWLVRFPPRSTPPPDSVDRMFRQIFVHSWPADLTDAVNMPLHNLLQRLLTYYASLVSQPPIS